MTTQHKKEAQHDNTNIGLASQNCVFWQQFNNSRLPGKGKTPLRPRRFPWMPSTMVVFSCGVRFFLAAVSVVLTAVTFFRLLKRLFELMYPCFRLPHRFSYQQLQSWLSNYWCVPTELLCTRQDKLAEQNRHRSYGKKKQHMTKNENPKLRLEQKVTPPYYLHKRISYPTHMQGLRHLPFVSQSSQLWLMTS